MPKPALSIRGAAAVILTLLAGPWICHGDETPNQTPTPVITPRAADRLAAMGQHLASFPDCQFEYTVQDTSRGRQIFRKCRFTKIGSMWKYESRDQDENPYWTIAYNGRMFYDYPVANKQLSIASDIRMFAKGIFGEFMTNPAFCGYHVLCRPNYQDFCLPELLKPPSWKRILEGWVIKSAEDKSQGNEHSVLMFNNDSYEVRMVLTKDHPLPVQIDSAHKVYPLTARWHFDALMKFNLNGKALWMPSAIEVTSTDNGKPVPGVLTVRLDSASVRLPSAELKADFFEIPHSAALQVFDCDLGVYIKDGRR